MNECHCSQEHALKCTGCTLSLLQPLTRWNGGKGATVLQHCPGTAGREYFLSRTLILCCQPEGLQYDADFRDARRLSFPGENILPYASKLRGMWKYSVTILLAPK